MLSGLVTVVAGAILISSGTPSATVGRIGRTLPQRHHPHRQVMQIDETTYKSDNWAGYAVTGSKVTDVSGSWIVPQAACTATGPNTYSSFWVGIDGFGTSSTVEQIGIDVDCQAGKPTYYAWFEFYPNAACMISFPHPIAPGDHISAEVSAVSASSAKGTTVKGVAVATGATFTATLTDLSQQGEKFTTSTTVAKALQASAEWIAEAPCCTTTGTTSTVMRLTNFGTAFFGKDSTGVANTSYATINGKTGTLASFGTAVQQVVMVGQTNSSLIKAQPSSVSSTGTSFNVHFLNPGP